LPPSPSRPHPLPLLHGPHTREAPSVANGPWKASSLRGAARVGYLRLGNFSEPC
jgi:hypothetical protein